MEGGSRGRMRRKSLFITQLTFIFHSLLLTLFHISSLSVNDEDFACSIISFRNTHISIIFFSASHFLSLRLSTFSLLFVFNFRFCFFFCSLLLLLMHGWWWWYSLSLNLCNFSSSFIAHVQLAANIAYYWRWYISHSCNSSCHVVHIISLLVTFHNHYNQHYDDGIIYHEIWEQKKKKRSWKE